MAGPKADTINRVKDIRKEINAVQGPALHYRDLSPTKRCRACEMLAEHSCRFFAVVSNKKNMRCHNKVRADRRGGKQWHYNYCIRLLMERVADFCLWDSTKRFGEPRFVKVIFSARGGHS